MLALGKKKKNLPFILIRSLNGMVRNLASLSAAFRYIIFCFLTFSQLVLRPVNVRRGRKKVKEGARLVSFRKHGRSAFLTWETDGVLCLAQSAPPLYLCP